MSKLTYKSKNKMLDAFQDDLKIHQALEVWAIFSLNEINLDKFQTNITHVDLKMLSVLKLRLAHHAVQEDEATPDGYPPADEL